jgi:predicted XRE-type DNA-binding protein
MTEIYRTPAGVSVLDDLGLDPAFIVKAKLAIRIHLTIKELGLNQREVARRIGISQPKLSQLRCGKFEGLSQAKLEDYLVALGHDVITNIGPRLTGLEQGAWRRCGRRLELAIRCKIGFNFGRLR